MDRHKITRVTFLFFLQMSFFSLLLIPFHYVLPQSSRAARYIEAVESLKSAPEALVTPLPSTELLVKAMDEKLTPEIRQGERDIFIAFCILYALCIAILGTAAGYWDYGHIAYLHAILLLNPIQIQLAPAIYFPRFNLNNVTANSTFFLLLALGIVASYAFSSFGKLLAKRQESRGV